ncbi:MAG: PIG-L family deacetylase [Chloroflexi bacterium]|nr:PIG-L family deacetylase [Chloroflexota bacterium]
MPPDRSYQHVYLSPHPDDAVLSCGGTIYQQTSHGEGVLVITCCAGIPDYENLSPFALEQHRRWGSPPDPVRVRRAEDSIALRFLGADYLHLDFLDCIYRRHPTDGTFLYASEDAILGEVHPGEENLSADIAGAVRPHIKPGLTSVYLPLGAGRHVDHQVVSRVARYVVTVSPRIVFYEDFPYVENPTGLEMALSAHTLPVRPLVRPLAEEDVAARIAAIRHYVSQIGMLFGSAEAMAQRVRAYCASVAGGQGYAERFWMGE